MTTQLAREMVHESLAMLNEEKADGEKISITDDVVLMGDDATLDSLDMINLVTELESRLFDATTEPIQLAAHAQAFEGDHAFQTAATLIKHIAELLESGSAHA